MLSVTLDIVVRKECSNSWRHNFSKMDCTRRETFQSPENNFNNNLRTENYITELFYES
jgi:hypothetical protein